MDRLRFLFLPVLVCGCTSVGPDYERPDTEATLPDEFNLPTDPALVPGEANLETWWELFEDPQLADLIQRAADQNFDIRIAIARVNEARARVDIVAAQGSPQVGVGGGAGAAGIGATSGAAYSLGVGATWELDVWGKITRQVEAATADFDATVEDQRDVMVSLYSEVARHYLAVRTYQARLRAAQRNLEAQREILGITQGLFDAGLSSRLDVAQAARVLANSEALVPPLRIQLVRSINTIAVLLGQIPRDVHEELETDKPIPVPPQQVTTGVPADLVRQRPDIRAAERRLAAQTARVGIATADLYPQFSLGGSLDLAAFGGTELFDAAGRNFFLGPSMSWNIYDGGRVKGQIAIVDFQVEQARLSYESTVLHALEEVESAVTAFLEQRVRADAMARAAGLAREELALGLGLYREGLVGFQNVLDAERAVFALESNVADARGAAATDLVHLYKALGGGWDPDAVETPDPEREDRLPEAPTTLKEESSP